MKIGKTNVKVVDAEFYSIVSFTSGEHGEREKGDYAFWTVVFKKKKEGRDRIIGRAHVSLPPTDRFIRLEHEKEEGSEEDQQGYSQLWDDIEQGKNVKHIRPSTIQEINRWMFTHQSDAPYAAIALVGGELHFVDRYFMLSE